jgi:predicted DCC family thiol-disulfide oxidoreductase YuxK
VLKYHRSDVMRFARLDGETARAVLARHPELAGIDSVVLIEIHDGSERAVSRSDAVVALARYLRWPWRAALALRAIPRPLRDWAYDVIASIRYRTFGRYDSCPVPPRAARSRFLP